MECCYSWVSQGLMTGQGQTLTLNVQKEHAKKKKNSKTKIMSISGTEPNEREAPSGWASSADALRKHAFMFANAAASDETFRSNFPIVPRIIYSCIRFVYTSVNRERFNQKEYLSLSRAAELWAVYFGHLIISKDTLKTISIHLTHEWQLFDLYFFGGGVGGGFWLTSIILLVASGKNGIMGSECFTCGNNVTSPNS